MTDMPIPPEPQLLLEPEDLDGHTVEELSDYLDEGRTPLDPSIERSPACVNALAALERLRDLARSLSREDAAADRGRDESWIDVILASINLDARAGDDVPLADDGATVMTEGALRALIRSIGDQRPGFLIGRIQFDGDITAFGTPITVALTVSIVEGFAIPEAVAALRHAITLEVGRHTALDVRAIDITVQDLQAVASIDAETDR